MKKRLNLLWIVLGLIVVGMVFFNQNSESISAAPHKSSSKVDVYKISKTEKGKKGYATNFYWIQNGKKVSFNEYTKGKVVFLNFWGTWCPPCRREIPDIIKINKELGNKDFVVIGIAMERSSNDAAAIKQVSGFVDKKGINYINLTGKYPANKELKALTDSYGGIPSVPTTYIIGKDKKIAEKIIGFSTYKAFMKAVKRAM